MRIRGTEEIPLQESINKWCRKRIDTGAIIESARKSERVDFTGLLTDLKVTKDEIKDSLKLCERALEVNKNIPKTCEGGVLNSPSMQAFISANEEMGAQLQGFHDSFKPFRLFLNKDFRKANSHEYLFSKDYSREKNLAKYAKRNKLVFSAARRALRELNGSILNVFSLLQRIKSSKERLQGHPSDGIAHYQYGKTLGEIGFHRLAVEEYKKALELGEGPSSLYEDLGESCFHLGELQQAKEYFQTGPRAGEKSRMGNGETGRN